MSDLESLRTDGCLHIKPDSKLSFNIDSLLSDLKDAYVAESPAPKNPLGFLVSVLQRIQNNLDENARRPIDSPLLLSQPHPQVCRGNFFSLEVVGISIAGKCR